MTRSVMAFLIGLVIAQPAHAGAWLREKDKGFLSFGATLFEVDDTGQKFQEQSFYLEYGLRPKLTIGASGSLTDGLGGEGQIFIRLPVPQGERTGNMAAEFGLGATSDGIDVAPYVRTGLSWGRGLTLRDKNGWVNIDGSALWGVGDSDTRFKIDSTVGLSVSDRTQIMAQSFLEFGEGADSHTLVPSVIISNKAGTTRYVIGYEHRTGSRASKGVKFGLWRDF